MFFVWVDSTNKKRKLHTNTESDPPSFSCPMYKMVLALLSAHSTELHTTMRDGSLSLLPYLPSKLKAPQKEVSRVSLRTTTTIARLLGRCDATYRSIPASS